MPCNRFMNHCCEPNAYAGIINIPADFDPFTQLETNKKNSSIISSLRKRNSFIGI